MGGWDHDGTRDSSLRPQPAAARLHRALHAAQVARQKEDSLSAQAPSEANLQKPDVRGLGSLDRKSVV